MSRLLLQTAHVVHVFRAGTNNQGHTYYNVSATICQLSIFS